MKTSIRIYLNLILYIVSPNHMVPVVHIHTYIYGQIGQLYREGSSWRSVALPLTIGKGPGLSF